MAIFNSYVKLPEGRKYRKTWSLLGDYGDFEVYHLVAHMIETNFVTDLVYLVTSGVLAPWLKRHHWIADQ